MGGDRLLGYMIKRLFDIVVSAVALAILSLAMLLVALLVNATATGEWATQPATFKGLEQFRGSGTHLWDEPT